MRDKLELPGSIVNLLMQTGNTILLKDYYFATRML